MASPYIHPPARRPCLHWGTIVDISDSMINVERHIKDEEDRILGMANKAFNTQDLEDMAKRFQRAKENISDNL